MSRVQSINAFVMNFINDASDILSPEQVAKLQAKWKKATPELKKEMKPKTAEQKAELAQSEDAKPKHFKSAYIFYCQQQRPLVKRGNPEASPKEIISILSQKWNNLSDNFKKPFETQAKADRARYDSEIAVYYEAHPDETPKSKQQKTKKAPTTAYQVFYEEQRELLKEQGLTGKDLQTTIFAKWKDVKANVEQLQHYKNLLNENAVDRPDQPIQQAQPEVSSEDEVETQDNVIPEVTEDNKANEKAQKRKDNIKKKLREIIDDLNKTNDTVTLNMIKDEVKNRKYRINKDVVKEIVKEIISEEFDQEEDI